MGDKGILNKVLNQDLSKVRVDNSGEISLVWGFPDKEEKLELSELRMLQIVLARRAIIKNSGYLGEQLKNGEYIEGDKLGSNWKVYHLHDGTNRVAVLWDHYDDDSWSAFFKGDNLNLDFLVYEN